MYEPFERNKDFPSISESYKKEIRRLMNEEFKKMEEEWKRELEEYKESNHGN